VTFRYCSPEEEKEIIDMYKSGEYSYQQIADIKNLSKGTVINIVKGYPYCQDKATYYARLREESADKLEQEITATKERAQKAYDRGNMSAYGTHTRQWLMLLDMLPDKDKIYDRLKDERMDCEQKAWQALGDLSYSEFGYLADTWELLADIIGDNAKNPWAAITGGAKSKSRSVRFAKTGSKRQNTNFIPTDTKYGCELSNESWAFIRPLVITNEHGRPSNHQKIMNGILYALANCSSFRSIPRKFGDRVSINRHFSEWYKTGVFGDLLSFVLVCPELEHVKPALLQIEKHRLIYGDVVPYISDIRKGVESEAEKNTDST